MLDELSEEDKKKYTKLRDEFRVIKSGIDEQIKFLEAKVQERKTILERFRPQVPGASRLCEKCDIIGMKYKETKSAERQFIIDEPAVYTPLEIYKCEVCGYEEETPVTTE